ncbi:unnamed protein product [Brachionus calyciflorus]|uniref:Uncharacterized protein n=1 Tax=Brachionus calyciflorus TaxID=104777 RepID=A0A814SH03_9BILA|nr:unnamed protein product [Brachionus calyciflorus]
MAVFNKKYLEENYPNLIDLEEIKLEAIEFESIELGAFKDLPNLKSLYFNGNQFETMSSEFFEGLENLTYLNLGLNIIKEFKKGVFSKLAKLESLEIEGVETENIDECLFDGLNELSKLNLKCTPCKSLSIISKLNKLKELNLMMSSVEIFQENALNKLMKSTRLIQINLMA